MGTLSNFKPLTRFLHSISSVPETASLSTENLSAFKFNLLRLVRLASHCGRAMETGQMFSYSPLSLPDKEIRLIVLRPCDEADAAIDCDIVCAKLPGNPKYEALSYTWGDGGNTNSIKLDDKVHHIRENLWLALRRLRLKKESRILWIDAICINQDDTIERNHQVNQMWFIYKQAERVVAWLGIDTDDSHIAMGFLEKLTYEPVVHHEYYGGYGFAKRWDALKALCERKYWSRLWIIQELVLASEIVVYCGVDKVDWSVFSSVCAQLSELTEPAWAWNIPILHQIRESVPGRLVHYRHDVRLQFPVTPPLFDLFCTFYEAKCGDIRDKIFGLLSLAELCCKEQVTVDYTKTPLEVCRSALSHHFLCHRESVDLCDTIRISYLAHSAIQGPTTDFIYKQRNTSKPDAELIEATGTIRGSICYLSDCVDVQELGNVNFVYDQPKLARLWDRRLNFLDVAERHWITPLEIDNVVSISDRNSYAASEAAASATLSRELSVSEHGVSVNGETMLEFIQSLMHYISYTSGRSGTFDKPRLILEENGMVGYAPIGTQIGDLVCEFKECNVIAIVRPGSHNRHRIVGRAACYKIDPQLFRLSNSDYSDDSIHLHLTIESLQHLTWSLIKN
jgi:hypothetical protein